MNKLASPKFESMIRFEWGCVRYSATTQREIYIHTHTKSFSSLDHPFPSFFPSYLWFLGVPQVHGHTAGDRDPEVPSDAVSLVCAWVSRRWPPLPPSAAWWRPGRPPCSGTGSRWRWEGSGPRCWSPAVQVCECFHRCLPLLYLRSTRC